jgi:hypothetical protein
MHISLFVFPLGGYVGRRRCKYTTSRKRVHLRQKEAPFGLAPIRAILLSRPIHYYTHNGLIKMDGLIYILGIYDEFGVCTEVE